jgi:hypothetical protein
MTFNINKYFMITFTPKQPELFNGRKRFSIGGGQLAKYIGESNAKAVLTLAQKSLKHNVEKRFRKMGLIKLYYR